MAETHPDDGSPTAPPPGAGAAAPDGSARADRDGTTREAANHAARTAPANREDARQDAEAAIDVGSWNRFIPSLTRWLQTGRKDVVPAVRLAAAVPIVTTETAPRERSGPGPLRLLRRRHRLPPSPLPPMLAAQSRLDGVKLTAPLRDDAGRALLGEDALAALAALGWRRREGAMMQSALGAESAARLAARVLIEVFDVAHPADLAIAVEHAVPPAA
ncbi:MAG: hypothetical protein E7Z94_01100 [Actinomyces ruminicola]|nr:hypothetical protein [Actinomyces ruminicola]